MTKFLMFAAVAMITAAAATTPASAKCFISTWEGPYKGKMICRTGLYTGGPVVTTTHLGGGKKFTSVVRNPNR
jgi:hypothetical protein